MTTNGTGIFERLARRYGSKFDWSRMHLIYFPLAGFDLLAVTLGLWLAFHSNSKFHTAVEHLDAADVVRTKTVALMAATMSLSEPANSVMSSITPEAANQQIEERHRSFVRVLFDQSGSAPFTLQVSEAKALDILGSGVKARFEREYKEILTLGEKMKSLGLQTAASMAKGDVNAAASTMENSDETFLVILGKVRESLSFTDELNAYVISRSVADISHSTKLQYMIAAMIAVMVAAVVAYAHFVGRILSRKFKELKVAHEESEAFGRQLLSVNDEVGALNRDLANNVKALTDAQDELVKKGRMAQLGQLTATIAHELRNPLGAVRTSTFLIERKLRDKRLGIEKQLERINNGVTRCDDIITQLLDFSRTKQLFCQPADLDAWLTDVVEEEAKRLPETLNLDLQLGLSGQHAPFDPARLQRAIINMISNSAEAMSDAKTPIGDEPRITISTSLYDDHFCVSVADNGPGIPPEVLAKVREPLFTTKSFGTGLGIPAIEQIAVQHGGRLDIVSEPGKGTVFTIWLPLISLEAEKAA